MKYILSEYFRSDGVNGFNATNKARNDALKIAVDSGYKHINLYESGKSKLKTVPQLIANTVKTILSTTKDDSIIVQYPYYPEIVNKFLFSALLSGKKMKKYKIIVLIHDIVFLRLKDINTCSIKEEINKEFEILKHFDTIICHNEKMKETLELIDGLEASLKILGPFYYLYDKEIQRSYDKESRIVIAGNLSREKTEYIYKLKDIEGLNFNLFGIGYTDESNEKIKYFGKFPPDELIDHLEGNYGLVWDGALVETCSGLFGNYLRFNNPHKLSLYIAAGLPIIVWDKSALAGFVKENGIGLCVESLNDLPELLENITSDEYSNMIQNIIRVRKTIVSGDNLVKYL